MLSPWITPDQGEIWRSATYRFHALVCRQWRDGRVFLAGDAAHQTPPFMAQGMNQGIRDAANLCWKLANVLRDRAAPALLDTYERERRPNVHAVIALTKRLGEIICERDPASAAARDARLLAEMRAGTGDIVRQDLLPPLDDGFLMRDAQGRLLPGVGRVFPQPMVECDGGVARMDDALGARWLLVDASAWRPGTDARRLASRLDVALVCVDGDRDDDGDDDARASGIKIVAETGGLIRDWLAAHDVHAALVRPDHIVFGTAAGPGAQERLLAALADAR
ncbi:MAG: FAD-dependent monooxygenase [Burkholderiaceae bacterium]